MAGLTEIVVDRKVLDGFKRRALRLYPREFIEQIVGKVVDHEVRIYAFRELEHQATRYEVVIDEDMDPMTEGEEESRYQILGTIHTHPQASIEPSEIDWEAMARDGELVMGICSIRKTAKRRFVSFAFYNSGRTYMQLTIAEPSLSVMSAKA
jgi:proteasome lid subunit RPN8/RPN11